MAAEAEWQNRVFGPVGEAIGKIYAALTRDGTLAAAGRQGIDEIGMALKACPDSIQANETGSIWNPTQGEVAAARAEPERLPSPSEIAKDVRPKEAEQDRGQEMPQQRNGWVARLAQSRQGTEDGNSGQNEQASGRSLAVEQRERSQGPDRGGRGR